ncbi:anionic trypsin-2-like [Thunnus thynnus]|uniref:anionic trypsin-2-like n=1 Tax=Thunnus thynnus TaxID=8237 RepID=UPI003529B644
MRRKTMMKSLIPLLLLASAVAGVVDIQKRVLNASPCPDDKGEHYVVLMQPVHDVAFCGGNLINQEWVLTAEHCNIGAFRVVLGRHTSEKEIVMRFIDTDEGKYFFEDDNKHRHDIMLLKLPNKPSVKLPIINVPDIGCTSPDALPEHNPYTIIGWSYTATDSSGQKNKDKPDKLQCGDIPLHSGCTGRNKDLHAVDREYVKEHMICSKSVLHCETCKGDSGGSLVKGDILYGVTVAGTEVPSGFSYFMDVCAYRKWIKDTAKF